MCKLANTGGSCIFWELWITPWQYCAHTKIQIRVQHHQDTKFGSEDNTFFYKKLFSKNRTINIVVCNKVMRNYFNYETWCYWMHLVTLFITLCARKLYSLCSTELKRIYFDTFLSFFFNLLLLLCLFPLAWYTNSRYFISFTFMLPVERRLLFRILYTEITCKFP